MRILFTNIQLHQRTGTETSIRDMSDELTRLGHQVVVYSPTLGCVSDDIRALGITVTDDLSALDFKPDIIQARHRFETMEALIRFPNTPVIFGCHDPHAWHDNPVKHPRILRYLTVDTATRDRLTTAGIPTERIRTVLNFVNLRRFGRRGELPQQPKRVLLFSNNARPDTHLPAVEEACRMAKLELDVVGFGVGRSCDAPEQVIGNYDIVIAKGKAAMEGIAVGAAVILCDNIGLGPMVNSRNFDQLRPLNFGHGATPDKTSGKALAKRFKEYDAQDAAAVCDRMRSEADMEHTAEELVMLYQQILDEFQSSPQSSADAEGRLHLAFLREMLDSDDMRRHRFADRSIGSLTTAIEAEQALNGRLQRQVSKLESSPAYRIGSKLMKLPGMARLLKGKRQVGP